MEATQTDDLSTAVWVVSVISVFSCSLVLSLIDMPFLRKMFSTTIGTVFSFYIYGPGYLWVIAQFMAVYLVMLVLPREAGAKAG